MGLAVQGQLEFTYIKDQWKFNRREFSTPSTKPSATTEGNNENMTPNILLMEEILH